MKIEILYPEAGFLYGDNANIKYLKLCLPDADFTETDLDSRPLFADGRADLVYMGPLTERAQEMIIKKLLPYKDQLSGSIQSGTHFLFTGNSFEVLGKYIKDRDTEIKALGIFDFHAERNMPARYNGLFLGEFEDMQITAFNSRFSDSYPGADIKGFARVERGAGLNKKSSFEGIRENNFIGTYLLGPILVINPQFCAYLLKSLGSGAKPAFFDHALSAYEKRLNEFKNCKVL